MDRPLLSIVVPIHNEINLIAKVLDRVRRMSYEPKELILVDDASNDGTLGFLRKEESKPNTRVLYHAKNHGKGAAIKTGIQHVNGEIVIIQDADMEYDPNEIPGVIEPILRGETDVAFGSRFLGKVERMRFRNRAANWILAKTVSLLYGQRITDEATAYKAFRRHVLEEMNLECKGFDFCPEVTAKVLRLGYRIVETPVTFVARTHFEGKKIGWRDFFVAMWVLIKIRFVRISRRCPNT
jgi:glycosyltransferase involved in cell wall biosynthesis